MNTVDLLTKKIRRMLPFTTFWGLEALAKEDSEGMYVNLLLDHKHPYFTRIMLRTRVVLEWHLSVKYHPVICRVCACRKDRVYLKSCSDVRGTWYLLDTIHAVLKKVQNADVIDGDELSRNDRAFGNTPTLRERRQWPSRA